MAKEGAFGHHHPNDVYEEIGLWSEENGYPQEKRLSCRRDAISNLGLGYAVLNIMPALDVSFSFGRDILK